MTTYTEKELAEAIKTVDAAEGTSDIPAHSWARCAKILRAELAQLRAENENLRNTICIDENDRPSRLWKLFEENEKLRDREGELALALQCASAANWDGVIWGRKSPFQKIIGRLVGNPPYEGIEKPKETIAQVCAYCGAGANAREEMMAHIETCEKHPMAKLRAELAQLRAELDEARYLIRKAYLDIHNTEAILWTYRTSHPEGKVTNE